MKEREAERTPKMQRLRFLAQVCSLSFAVTGCAGVWTPPEPLVAPRQPMRVEAPFARTWDAAIDVFADRTIPIRTIDRASGLIVAEPTKVEAGQAELADCGLSPIGIEYAPTDANWNLIVRSDSTHSTVKATVRFLAVSQGVGATSIECTSRGVWETQLEERIKAAAEAKKP